MNELNVIGKLKNLYKLYYLLENYETIKVYS